jgi:hypothetical protein
MFVDLLLSKYCDGGMNLPRFIRGCAGVTVCLLALCGMGRAEEPERGGRNLLQNGDFEKGTEGWVFQAWKDRVAKAAKDPEVRHLGRPSVRIDQPNPTDGALVQAVTLKPHTRYRLEGWIKTRSVEKPNIPKQRQGPEGASLTVMGNYQKTPSVLGTSDWTHVHMEFVTDAKTDYKFGCRLGHYGKLVTGTAWYADVSLVDLDPGNSPR